MRLNMPRDFYYPRLAAGDLNVEHVKAEDNSEVVTYTTRRGNPGAMVFSPKAKKPDWHYTFFNEAQRTKRIAEWQEGRRLHAEFKAKMAADRAKPHTLKVGDILNTHWGYEQTNIEFFEVTKVVSGRTVEVREIAAESSPETGFMTATKWAVPGAFVGEPLVKRASAGNSVKIDESRTASPWDGKPARYSWYA